MRHLLRFTFFAAALLYATFAAAEVVDFKSTPVDMFVGESKVFSEKNVKRIAIGAGRLIKVKELPNHKLMIIANAPGSTTVHVWYKNKDWQPRAYNIRISENDPSTRVRQDNMVRFKVRLIEFRKSRLDELGIDWAESINGPSAAVAGSLVNSNLFSAPIDDAIGSLPNAISGWHTSARFASSITSRINFLAANGSAATIAEPTLICLNGGEADFHAGGQLPLPSTNENGSVSVEYKPYGIRLSVKPTVSDTGIIDTVVTTEVSEVDSAVSVENIPGLITRNTTTRVQVQNGDTIVLAGLLSERIGRDSSSVPGLGKLPLVGKLFSNERTQHEKTELVMFLTPEVVHSGNYQENTTATDRLQLQQERLQSYRDKISNNLVD
ncbi:MAG: type II and III secretion system protein family protein [Granulosicoccaceae bacterium]